MSIFLGTNAVAIKKVHCIMTLYSSSANSLHLLLFGEEACIMAVTISQLVFNLAKRRSLLFNCLTSFADVWLIPLFISLTILRNWPKAAIIQTCICINCRQAFEDLKA